MLRRLSIGLLASTITITPLPTKAEDGTAEDLGDVLSISLEDVVSTTLADQCALQVANAGSGVLGWLEYEANDLTVSDSLSYDESLDTRFTADLVWRLGVKSLEGNKLDRSLSDNSHPSSMGNDGEKVRHLHLCLSGMSQPLLLPPLPLPSLEE